MACKPPVSYSNPRDLGQVQAPLRDRLWTAMHDAPRKGLILVSGKRTDYMQWLLRGDHGCRGRECDTGCKGWPTTAVPGRSRHRNITPDISAADMGGIDLYWLGENEAKYGIDRTVAGERWHFQVVGAPKVRIIKYGTTGTNVNEGHHWVSTYPGDFDGVNGPVYKRGGYDNQVAEIQIRLKKLRAAGWLIPDVGTVDGVFGDSHSKTSAASMAFHVLIQKMQQDTGREVWGPATPMFGPKKIEMLRWFAN